MAVAGIGAGTTLWARRAWHAVEFRASFHPPRSFLGEPVVLRIRMRNGKAMPLPVVNLGIWLPPGLLPGDETPGPAGYRGMWMPEGAVPGEVSTAIRGFRRRLALGPRSEAVIDLPVRATARGEFWVERIDVELADPFFLTPMRREEKPDAALLVMPEPRIALPMEIRRRLPFGTPIRAARLFEERERFAGVRPYEPGDPLGRIHWRLTGHAGALQTKLFEPTRGAKVLLALDLAVGEPFWDRIYPEIAEDTIGWASFLARQAISEGWTVGLIANTHLSRYRGPLRVAPSAARGHEAALFSALARMPNEPTADMAPVLREVVRTLQQDTVVVLLSPRPGPALEEEIRRAGHGGPRITVLSPLEASLRGGAA